MPWRHCRGADALHVAQGIRILLRIWMVHSNLGRRGVVREKALGQPMVLQPSCAECRYADCDPLLSRTPLAGLRFRVERARRKLASLYPCLPQPGARDEASHERSGTSETSVFNAMTTTQLCNGYPSEYTGRWVSLGHFRRHIQGPDANPIFKPSPILPGYQPCRS